jgi:hypothetical protein
MDKDKEEGLIRRTSLITVFTFACFVIGCLIFFKGEIRFCDHHGSVFHEIAYNPRQIIDQILQKAAVDTSFVQTMARKDTAKVTSSAAIAGWKETDRVRVNTINLEIKDRRYQLMHVSDSVAEAQFAKGKLYINRDAFTLSMLDEVTNVPGDDKDIIGYTQPVKWVYFFDSKIAPQRFEAQIRMPLRKFDSNVDFLMRNPGFGVWIILMLVQFALYPALIFKAILAIHDFRVYYGGKLNKEDKLSQIYSTSWKAGISLLAVVIFLFLSLGTYQDAKVIKGSYFFDHIQCVFWTLNPLGYLLAVVCFTGFLNIANFVFWYKHDSATPNFDSTNATEILKMTAGIKQLFSTLITFAALTLSISVFTTGSLFSAVNSMDFIKKITQDIGYSPLRYDCVYMYGIINTVLLLFFYIPARLYINDLNKELAENGIVAPAGATTTGNGIKFLSLKDFGGILVAGSPLIASLLQYLLDLIT